MLFPGFQFGADGRPLPVIRILRDLADEARWSENGVVQWLCAPTFGRLFATGADQLWLIDLCAPLHVNVLLAS